MILPYPFQYTINEVFGQFHDDKESMFDILDEWITGWILEKISGGYSTEEINKGLQLYFFFTRLLREVEISFEEEI